MIIPLDEPAWKLIHPSIRDFVIIKEVRLSIFLNLFNVISLSNKYYFRGVYVPGKGTYVENAEVESTTPSHRVNYNYHPIIDFFRSTLATPVDRVDTIDDWLPMTEGPRAMPKL